MPRDKSFITYLGFFYLALILVVIVLYIINPMGNKCIRGDCKNGRGVYLFNSGMKYEGDWISSRRHGQGTLTYPDSSQYKGGWEHNRMHGFGVKTYVNNKVFEYAGEWKNGHKHGQGTQIYRSSRKKEWKNELKHVQGTPFYRSYTKYVGQWKEGERNGKGTLITARSKYVGEWKKDSIHGQGTQMYTDGRVFKGTWRNNVKHGVGIMTYRDGRTFTEKWVNGILIGSPLFYMYEFETSYVLKDLHDAIKADISISLQAKENTVKWLNELLKVPALYNKLPTRYLDNTKFSADLIALIEATKDIRDKSYSNFKNHEKENIQKLNRLLLEHIYPKVIPKAIWE